MEPILYKYNIDLSQVNCMDTYLGALHTKFNTFAQSYDGEIYFTTPEDEAAVQNWTSTFECGNAALELLDQNKFNTDVILQYRAPTINENLQAGTVWSNKSTGEIFTCIDATSDKNIWISADKGKIIRPIPPADKFDFFGDKSAVAFLPLNGDTKDNGGLYHGVATNVTWKPLFDQTIPYSGNSGQILINNLPFDNTTETVTVASWAYWDGANACMLYGWNNFDLYCYQGNLGFNTFNGDLYGIDFKAYKKQWVYLVVVFKKGTPGKIFINGVQQTVSQLLSAFIASHSVLVNKLAIFGCLNTSGYRAFGAAARVKIFNRELTPIEVAELTMADVELIKSVGGNI